VALKSKVHKNQLTLFVSSKFEQGVDAQFDTKAPISHDSHRIQASQELHLYFVQKTCPCGQVLAISELLFNFRVPSHSPFAMLTLGANRQGVLRMSVRLGEILIKESLITQDQLQKALEFQRSNGGKLGSCLTKMGFITDDDITGVLSRQYGVPSINLKYYEIDPNVIKLIPQDTALRYQVIPLSRVGSVLTIAMTDPTNVFAMDDIKFMTGFNVEPVVASESAIGEAISRFYGGTEQNTEELSKMMKDLVDEDQELELAAEEAELDTATLEKAAEEAPIIKLVNLILTDSVKRGASDIHIEPYELEMRVRFRVDGQLQTVMTPPLRLKDAITSRLKIMAKLDIAEKRLPQDGRIMIKYKADGKKKELDFRVSTVPTLFGEKIVLRLLDKENLRLDMTKLGFESESLKKFERNILKPYGMVLVTGPTGSGKTNTLYSAVARLNTVDTNIMTAEDPVEFQLAGINQVQMKEQIGLNFAAALRAFLRQDPNIILVGEIRDFETAEIAVKAALTGHLVLSTLHTNDAPSTISRLMNMGIEPFLVATSVNLICAQRLVRRICSNCKEELELPEQALIDAGYSPDEVKTTKIYHGKGCNTCNKGGYKGRTGLYEVMEVNDELRELILVGASALELKKKAIEQGMITLRRSGLVKVALGQTTLEEVLRETVL
jgi:type IV pilus assembly protein PilB